MKNYFHVKKKLLHLSKDISKWILKKSLYVLYEICIFIFIFLSAYVIHT